MTGAEGIEQVLSVVQALCWTGGGLCAVGALILYAMSRFGSGAEGAAEGRLMGLILAAMAFFAAGFLVTMVNTIFPGM